MLEYQGTRLAIIPLLCLLPLLTIGGCVSDSSDGEPQFEVLTESFSGWLVARSVSSPTGIETTLSDDAMEAPLLTVQHDFVDNTFTVDHPELGYSRTLAAEPGTTLSLEEANRKAVRMYRVMPTSAEAEDRVAYDNFGCDTDGWPVGPASCGQDGACCDSHDQCYSFFGCTALSWITGTDECKDCNDEVLHCIATTNPGPSSCCAAGNCGVPRPINCVVGDNGQCQSGGGPGIPIENPGDGSGC